MLFTLSKLTHLVTNFFQKGKKDIRSILNKCMWISNHWKICDFKIFFLQIWKIKFSQNLVVENPMFKLIFGDSLYFGWDQMKWGLRGQLIIGLGYHLYY